MDMFKKITRRDFEYPRDFTPEEQAFIGGLLQVDLTRRLGNMHGGVDDIRNQPYFAGCVPRRGSFFFFFPSPFHLAGVAPCCSF